MQKYSFSMVESRSIFGVVLAGSKGVSNIALAANAEKLLSCLYCVGAVEGGEQAERGARGIELYLEGKIREFDLEIDISSGTSFQKSVWQELLKIPLGEVITYKDMARRIGNPKAARAVGAALGANPIPIIIPCHRVVGANDLGGYTGGVEIKRKLLAIEGILS